MLQVTRLTTAPEGIAASPGAVRLERAEGTLGPANNNRCQLMSSTVSRTADETLLTVTLSSTDDVRQTENGDGDRGKTRGRREIGVSWWRTLLDGPFP